VVGLHISGALAGRITSLAGAAERIRSARRADDSVEPAQVQIVLSDSNQNVGP
jgi:hypothetical protein